MQSYKGFAGTRGPALNTTVRDSAYDLPAGDEILRDRISILETKLNREVCANLALKDEIARLKKTSDADVQDKRKTNTFLNEFPRSPNSVKAINNVDPSIPKLNDAARIKMQATIDELQFQLDSVTIERDSCARQLGCYNEFNLPFNISTDDIKETSHNIGFDKQLVQKAKQVLVNALKEEKKHLFKVSSNVIRQMRGENRHEQWMCNIRPVQVEDGFCGHAYSAVVLQFNREGYEYFVGIRQLYDHITLNTDLAGDRNE